jgi:hypothetical protein
LIIIKQNFCLNIYKDKKIKIDFMSLMKYPQSNIKHYCELVDDAMGQSLYQHRTLRTCLDPGSYEWSETSMKKKIEILENVIKAGNDLQRILWEYKSLYRKMNKPHVANSLEEGLTELLKYVLKQKE